ncbi:MAG: magnesium transporter [Proteobacteria bacterium]|nr:MAG: magnesium transporter [Pseudomonadota bacterium]
MAPDDSEPNDGSEAYPLSPDFVAQVGEALEAGDAAAVLTLVEPLHEADIADLIGLISPEERPRLIAALGPVFNPEVLSELDETVRAELLETAKPAELAAAVAQLDTDDAVDILEELDEDKRQEVLDVLPAEERTAVEEGLSYPEESAGRLMRRELVAVPQFWTVGQTIDHLRESDDLPDDFHEIFVVDPRYHPVGAIPLNRIMRAKRPVAVAEIMETEPDLIPATMDQEEVAHIFKQYNLLSAPVVDGSGRLAGVITVDDVVDVIQEEAEEDILRMAGVSDAGLNESVRDVSKTRLLWLSVNLGTAVLASWVISLFDVTIEKLVALAVLMPIVASMGGNAGHQTMTVAVRALATRELMPANALRVVKREVLVGLINGILLALIIGVVAGVWFSSPLLGFVLGWALVINFFVAGLCGVLIPIGLQRLGVDPAVASSVFLTTVTDVVGFFSFLGLAAWILL